jgi:hypothetical protein
MSVEIKKVQKFCKSKSKDDFNSLSLQTKNLFIKIAQIAIITPSVLDKSFSLFVLKLLREKPETIKKSERKKAETLLSNFDVSLTGARINDILIGIKPVSKKAVIKIHKKDILTQKRDLNVLRNFSDLWDKYLDKLGSIPFFTNMSKSERQLYVSLNTDEKESAIGDKKEQFEIIQVGNSDFVKKLSEEQLETLMGNKHLTIQDIYSIFPKKPGSRAKRQTLIMLKSFWTLSVEYEINDNFDGYIIDISNSDNTEIIILDGLPFKYILKTVNKEKVWVRTTTQKVGFKINKERTNINTLNMLELSHQLDIKDDENLLLLNNMLSILTAGQLKSLLQKLIRFKSTYVDINLENDENKILIEIKTVLFITMYLLIKNVGSLIPDIQKFVSGLTSFCKRLAIISCEDSFILNDTILLSLYIGALLSQRVKIWYPDYNIIKLWFKYGLNLLENDKCHIYDIDKGLEMKPYIINNKNTILQNCSAILDDLKSFKTDLGLVRNLASQKTFKIVNKDKIDEKRVMPLYHYIDQHCCPNFAYFYNYKILPIDKVNPFGKTFDNVFKYITGINPRKKDIDINNEFVIETKNAQRLYAKMLFSKDKKILKESKEIYSLDYTLDDDFI